MSHKKKRLRARVKLCPRSGGPAITKWASGYTHAELEAEKYRIRREFEDLQSAQSDAPAGYTALAVAGTVLPGTQPGPAECPAPCAPSSPADELPAAPVSFSSEPQPAPASVPASASAPESAGQTFEAYALHWYKLYKEPKIRLNTQKMYKNVFQNHLFPRIGSMPLESITRDVLQEMLNTHYSKGVSASLIDKIVMILRLVFGDAFEEDVIKKDPTRRLDPPEGTFEGAVPLDMHEVDALTQVLPLDKKDGLLPLLLIWTGLRRSEAYGLQWGDIAGSTLSVKRAVIFDGNQPVIGPPKSAAGYRNIPIPEPLLSMLREQRSSPDLYVFGGISPWTECKSKRTWARIKGKYEILSTHTMHEMRHTYNQILRYRGVDPATIQYLMGHADYETTVEHYTDITEDDTGKALELITPPQYAQNPVQTVATHPVSS